MGYMLKFFHTRKCIRKKFVDNLFTQVALAWMREELHKAQSLSESLPPCPTPLPGQVCGCGHLHWEAQMET